jgi:ribonuclease HI
MKLLFRHSARTRRLLQRMVTDRKRLRAVEKEGGYGDDGFTWVPIGLAAATVRKKRQNKRVSQKPKMSRLLIYTDGACSGNGTPQARAGCGVWFKAGDPRNLSLPLPLPPHTNQRAELYAFLLALQAVLEQAWASSAAVKAEIRSDSTYCVKGYNEWMAGWIDRDWQTRNREPVSNQDLWRRVLQIQTALEAEEVHLACVWVKGHADEEGNVGADALAVAGVPEAETDAEADPEAGSEADAEADAETKPKPKTKAKAKAKAKPKPKGKRKSQDVTEAEAVAATCTDKTVRLAVVGSRGIADDAVIAVQIDAWRSAHVKADQPFELVSGGARGVDSGAAAYASAHELTIHELKPDWATYGRGAGLRRNHDIIRQATHVLAIWDGESRGTQHSMSLAKKQGKPLTTIIIKK